MARRKTQLRHAAEETLEHIRINGDPDATIEDAIEHLQRDCGLLAEGSCTMAGSEYCDLRCPFF
jgi:hypothetical protein